MPADSRRMRLARSISRWLTISASAGTSFCVAMKNLEVFMRQHRHCLYRWAVEKSVGRIVPLVNLGGAAHARQGRLPSECRHHPRQPEERGVLGQAGQSARLAVPARRHQARRNPAAGDVPRARGGDRAAARPRAHPRPYPRMAALRGTREMDAPRLQERLPRPEADLVPAAHGRARLRRQAPRERASRVRCLALARLLDPARDGDRLQARRLSPGADRAAPLLAGRPPRAPAAPRSGPLVRYPMERDYQPLPIRELGANAGFRRPLQPQAPRVTAESPAAQVMTDFTRVAPATIRPQAPLAGANQFMITRGVRLLLVTDDHENVLGIITATDILSERPMRAAIDRALRRAGRQHALAVEKDGARNMVRGIFSISQIARQLGVAVPTGGEVARTFSEIESAIK